MSANLELCLSPTGELYLAPSDSAAELPAASPAGKTLASAFEQGSGQGLLRLGALEPPVPPSFVFWHHFARRFLTELCLAPELEATRGVVEVAFPYAAFAGAVPLMTGAEYFSVKQLERNWRALHAAFAAAAAAHAGPVQALLGAWNPSFHAVGRVHFHLAENKNHPTAPFAFLATYTTGLRQGGKAAHVPLAQALQEFAGARNKAALAKLLEPVRGAAEKSEFLKALVENGALFQTLAWQPAEAYAFLRDVPHFEAAGVLCRVPNWWKEKRSRLRVQVTVGGNPPQGAGLEALLSFSAGLALDGEPISAEEWARIAKMSDGLALIRGQWVELDREKLKSLLARWKKAEKQMREGVGFAEALRLMSGVGADAVEGEEWQAVEAGGWLQSVLEKLAEPSRIERVDPGPQFAATLRPYQEAGLRWLWFLQRLGLGACLADDMGLGKTVQVLALLSALREQAPRAKTRASLLIAPASLLGNWQAELAKFAPHLRAQVVHASAGATGFDAAALRKTELVITTYGMAARLDALREPEWRLLILDEAQAIKNAGTKQARAVKALKAEARIALTGTPVENHLGDLWSLFDFLNPGLLGPAERFERWTNALASRPTGYAPLRKLVAPYILRRMKTDKRIVADLPDKTEMTAYCGLTKTQAVLYQKSVDELAGKLDTLEPMERRGAVLAYLTRLKQICNHPSQFLGDNRFLAAESAKFLRLRELCESIAARQEKALVFTQFQSMTAPLAGFLESQFGRRALTLDGSTPVKRRAQLVDDFQSDGRTGFFVISLKAGGVGLNLTAAQHVVHFDRWWNPSVENQATDRAFRIGQKNAVFVHKFVCRGTVEERIDEMLRAKARLADEVLTGAGDAFITELGNEELLAMLRLDLAGLDAAGV